MPRSMKLRLVLPVLIVALAALVVVAGCGGSDDGGSGETDPASVAPAKAPVFIGFTVRPEGETKENIEALAQKIAGVDDLGELIITELENEAADEGEEFDYEKEVEPWLGRKAASSSRTTKKKTSKATALRSRPQTKTLPVSSSTKKSRPTRTNPPRTAPTRASTSRSRKTKRRSASSTASSLSPKTKRPSKRWSTPPTARTSPGKRPSPPPSRRRRRTAPPTSSPTSAA